MMYKAIKYFVICGFLLLPLCLSAQQVQDEEEEIKQMREAIDQEIDERTAALKLEDWQIFYMDSILTHDYDAMRVEMKALRDAKVSNSSFYTAVQDKWAEQVYQSFHKILNEDQWAKYLRGGASRDKKARDKRAAKQK